MADISANNKRIAKNTLFLYFRMLLLMAVTLYTSRVVLDKLGITDYGIYNVVGGIVTMLGFLNTAMSVATQRFLSYEIGRDDFEQLKKVFSSSILIHSIIAFIILIISETVGLWFLNSQLSISEERMNAANWVYQFSILSFIINVLSVPYNALIISHERMGVYAYISIIEVVLKLLIVFLLSCFDVDRLILYAFLVFAVSLFIRILYQCYCSRKYPESKFKFVWQRDLLQRMISFSGWSLFGGIAYMAKSQGINVVLNIFFGATVNAAWGIAQQVNSAVLMFVQNFVTAINPPIIKAYAKGERDRLFSLLFNGMKYTFFLASCLIVPLLVETDFVLSFWLKEVPDYTVLIVQYVLVVILIELFSHAIGTTIQATGEIKWYQIVVGSILFLNLPLSYIAICWTSSPISPMYVAVGLSITSMFFRFCLLYHLIHFPLSCLLSLFKLVVIFIVLIFASVYWLHQELSMGIVRFLLVFLSAVLLSAFVLFFCGMSKNERERIRFYAFNIVKRYAK